MMTGALLLVALVGYAVGIVLASLGTVYRSEAARQTASVVFVITWIAHLGAVVAQAVEHGRMPLTNLGEYLLVLGWIVLGLHLAVWFRMRVQVVGLVLPPIAAMTAFASWAMLARTATTSGGPRGWFLFHTSVSTLGMATLCVAFAMSLLYLMQDHALKSKKAPGLLGRLPALEKCDQVGFNAMLVGFLLLTLGIGTGVVVNANVYERIWVLGAKQILAVLAWIVFATIIASRVAFGFRGRKSAYLTITGFALGALTVLGMTR